MNRFIASQILVLFAFISIGISYLMDEKKYILFLAMIYCVFYALQYLLLGAYTGTLIVTVSLIRNLIFYINDKKHKKNNIFVLFSLIIIAIIFGLLSYVNIYCIFPIIASILSTYSLWQENIKLYKYIAILVSVCYIIYAISVPSISAVIMEAILLILEIIGIIKYIKNKGECL